MKKLLHIDSSARTTGSQSRQLSRYLVERLLEGTTEPVEVIHEDISQGLPLLDETLIGAYFTPPDQRSEAQQAAIRLSDRLVDQLEQADTIVIGLPMYNFQVPASFKAWIDLVARAGRTFRYTAEGPEGLLRDRPVHVIVATGGVALGSAADHLTPWLRFVLGFLGLKDVRIVAADQLNRDAESRLTEARARIDATLAA